MAAGQSKRSRASPMVHPRVGKKGIQEAPGALVRASGRLGLPGAKQQVWVGWASQALEVPGRYLGAQGATQLYLLIRMCSECQHARVRAA